MDHPNFIDKLINCEEWLGGLGLSQYSNLFLANFSVDNQISLKKISRLEFKDLPRLNITDFDHQKLILESIRHMAHEQTQQHVLPVLEEVAFVSTDHKLLATNLRGDSLDSLIDSNHPSSTILTHASSSNAVKTHHPKHVSRIPSKELLKKYDENMWNSIHKLRHEGATTDSVEHLRKGGHAVSHDTLMRGPNPSGDSLDAQLSRSRRGSFNNSNPQSRRNSLSTGIAGEEDALQSSSGRARRGSFHKSDKLEKMNNYGNIAQEFDIVQKRLGELQRTHLDNLKSLVGCEVANIFFVVQRLHELSLCVDNKWFRVPLVGSIAGTCATTGEVLNIPDAYADPRFNSGMDKQTGFRTRSMLCEPVRTYHGAGEVIGVIMLLNKIGSTAFDEHDEELLQVCVSRVCDELESKFKELLKASEAFHGIGSFVGGGAMSTKSHHVTDSTAASVLRRKSTTEMMERRLNVALDEAKNQIAKDLGVALPAVHQSVHTISG